MKASRLILCVLSACCVSGLALADEGEVEMDTIVVIGQRPQMMDFAELVAAQAAAAALDFDELMLWPPQVEAVSAGQTRPRDEFALADDSVARS